jgi:hypothetical protein
MASSGVPLAIAEGNGAEAPGGAGKGTAIDLAAWGRGEKNYIWSEVQKAIDDHAFGKLVKVFEARMAGVNSRHDALNYLIEEDLISANEARTDL